MISMTIARDFGSRWSLLYCVPKSVYLLYYGRSPNGLWYAKRARRSTVQLYFVSAKKESCLPLYIVQGSHRIDERKIHHIDST
jgi:hypothetical protein